MSEKSTSFYKNKKISCGDQLLDLNEPKIMGILNLTEDSFFDGGKHNKGEKYLYRAAEMIEAGVDIIDIGAASTRPGAKLINENDEWEILQNPIRNLKRNFPNILLSVDTYNAKQVKKCAHSGVNIINDISGGSWDDRMFQEISEQSMAYVLMHIQGQPDNMQNSPSYHSVIDEVSLYFKEKTEELKQLNFQQIILDPGFGFGKTIEHNYKLLAQMKQFESLGFPLLAGLSRKSMVFKVLNNTPEESLNGTSVLNTLALQNGASILRVHDVKEANETIQLFSRYKRG